MDTEELIRLLKTCKERFCKEDEEWKKCFKRNIFIHHPDKGGEEENFKELNNCNAMVKDLEAAERARAEAAEWEDVAEFPWSEETQIDDTGTASEYSDSDGEYPQESTATSPSRPIGRGRVEKSPKHQQNRNSISTPPRNMTGILKNTMKIRFARSRSASRRRRDAAAKKREAEANEQLKETKEETMEETKDDTGTASEYSDSDGEMRRREVPDNWMSSWYDTDTQTDSAAARERERRRALDERESRAEVSQNCCWTLTFI